MDKKTPEKDTEGKPKEQKRKSETKLGYKLDEVASALQKEIRRGDTDTAVYWALLLNGTAPQYCWKRVLVAAVEDIGLADPDVVHKVCGLAQAWKIAKEQAWYVSPHHVVMAVTLLCRAPKNTEIEDLLSYTHELIARGIKKPMEDYSTDVHTEAGRARGLTVADWYDTRHLRFGIPVNRYTKMLAEMIHNWFSPELKDLLKAREEKEKANDHDR